MAHQNRPLQHWVIIIAQFGISYNLEVVAARLKDTCNTPRGSMLCVILILDYDYDYDFVLNC